MKKRVLTLVLLAFAAGAMAQTQAEKIEALRKQIESFESCYLDSRCTPYGNSAAEINGKKVDYKSKVDFKKRNFTIGDPAIENDVRVKMKDIDMQYSQEERVLNIFAHGLIDQYLSSLNKIKVGDANLVAEDVAALIIKQMDGFEKVMKVKNEPFTIVIHSCKAGMGQDSFAQQLSVALAKSFGSVSVVASPDLVWPAWHNGKYSEKIAPTRAQLSRPDFMGENWIVFKNGQKYMEGTPDAMETVRRANEKQHEQLRQSLLNKYKSKNK